MTGAETAPNIAEIHIEEDRLRLVLEIFIGDLEIFADLVPDDLLADPDSDRPNTAQRLRRFSLETFRVVTDKGVPLDAELKLAEPRLRKDRFTPLAGAINPFTGRKAPEAPADKRVLYVEIDYPFAEPPARLTLIPPRDENGAPLVTIGFVTYHDSVPVIDFRYLTGPATVSLNWDDPWYSKFDNVKLTRHHKSGLMSFIYVRPHEVRHEILARVKDLEPWLDLDLRDQRFIEADEWEMLKSRVGDFLLTRNRASIDDRDVEPFLDGITFVTTSLQGIQTLEEPQRLKTPTAMLGVILTYFTDGMPDTVRVHWDLFNHRIEQVPVIASDPAGPFPSFVEPTDPTLEWRNFLTDYRPPSAQPVPLDAGRFLAVPLLTVASLCLAAIAGGFAAKPRLIGRRIWLVIAALGLIGAVAAVPVATIEIENPLAGPPDETVAADIVGALVGNLHNALRLRDEVKLRDALAVTVSKARLDEVLPELRRAFAIRIQGGGAAELDAVDAIVVREIERLPDGGFRALAAWSAEASAGHWGHLHRRRIRFDALMEIVPADGAWKLAAVTVVDQRQEG
nr:hypothetical protein [Desulfuromonadales bacterium]